MGHSAAEGRAEGVQVLCVFVVLSIRAWLSVVRPAPSTNSHRHQSSVSVIRHQYQSLVISINH